ncbi:MAG: phospholipase A, partial [Butyricimonas faecihominis]
MRVYAFGVASPDRRGEEDIAGTGGDQQTEKGGSVVLMRGRLELFDNTPSFSIFRDIYFVTGVPTNRKIDKHSSEAKFQISIRQRLTKSILPFKTFLYLTYTQRSFWDIYGKSSPFLDNNFNPGLSLSKALIYRNQLMGIAVLSFEHES